MVLSVTAVCHFIVLYSPGQQTFSVKGQTVKILGFERYTVPVTAAQFDCHNAKAAIDSMSVNECRCGPIKLYLQK